jgi:hypothetical protein
MTDTNAVLIERDGPITIVSINRPHCRNAVDGATARFPQACLRADRLSALRQWDLPEEEAIANEMSGGLEVIASGETLSGAKRFASGIGRHGNFGGDLGNG